MDSYDKALSQLNLITSEAGWYVYCFEEEEWHLYNEEGELLFATKTIEQLVNSFEPAPNDYNTALIGRQRENPYKAPNAPSPVKVDPQYYTTYDDKQRQRAVNEDKDRDRHG